MRLYEALERSCCSGRYHRLPLLLVKVEERQRILEALDTSTRLEVLCQILMQELEVLELENKIQSRVRKQN